MFIIRIILCVCMCVGALFVCCLPRFGTYVTDQSELSLAVGTRDVSKVICLHAVSYSLYVKVINIFYRLLSSVAL